MFWVVVVEPDVEWCTAAVRAMVDLRLTNALGPRIRLTNSLGSRCRLVSALGPRSRVWIWAWVRDQDIV